MTDNKLTEKIVIPEGIEVKVDGRVITVKGPKGETTRDFKFPQIKSSVEGNEITIEAKGSRKSYKKDIYTMRAHLRNMLEGVQNGFKYTLKICSGHFPMNVSLNGNQFSVKNFLGEKVPRLLTIKEGVDVTVSDTEVTVESIDIEKAGQVAADIEQLTRVTNKDIRIFQDGLYITKKPKKDII